VALDDAMGVIKEEKAWRQCHNFGEATPSNVGVHASFGCSLRGVVAIHTNYPDVANSIKIECFRPFALPDTNLRDEARLNITLDILEDCANERSIARDSANVMRSRITLALSR